MERKDIPREMMEKFRKMFDENPSIVRLRLKQSECNRRNDYISALKYGMAIDELFDKFIDEGIAEAEKEAKNVPLEKAGIPKEDIHEINEIAVAMFMACDIIDTCVLDIDDVLHRTDKELKFEMFGNIQELARQVREKLEFLRKNSTYTLDYVWGDKCDDMYEMIRNKARAVIRKHADSGQSTTI